MAKIILTLPTISGGGDSGNTNLSYISSPIQGTVTSDTGTSAIIPLADITNAGLLSPSEKLNISTALQSGDNVSELTNDANYITLVDIPTFVASDYDLEDFTNVGVDPFAHISDLSDVTGLVPYTGATTNVDLGEFQLTAGQLEFDQTPIGTAGVAKLRWNDVDGTLDLGLKGGNVTLQLGQEQVVRIVNKTGVNLLESAYQVVYISGAQGNRLKVDLALANSDLTSSGTIGIVTENINNNQEGFITSNGLVRGINTTGSLQGETWADGDILYVSASVAGKLTNIKPIAPQHTVIVGILVSAHITQGAIFVKVDNGYELEELHNVLINTPSNNEVLVYESVTSLWKNKTIPTILGFTPENVDNKQNSLAIDGTGLKYPTVDAVNAGITSVTLGFTPENVINKSSSYTLSSTTTYANTKALVDGLETKANIDGTLLYHSLKWFTPSSTVSSSGTTVTSVGTQFTASMVGAKLIISGEPRIITGYTSTTVVTVASAYSTNYSGVDAGSWGVYSKAFQNLNGNDRNVFFGTTGVATIFTDLNNNLQSNCDYAVFKKLEPSQSLHLNNGVNLGLSSASTIKWASTTNGEVGTKDVGLRRDSAGVLEIFDGITAGTQRDLKLRNLTISGTPTAPTATVGTNTMQLATTAFVQGEISTSARWAASGNDIYNSNSGNIGIGTSAVPTKAKFELKGEGGTGAIASFNNAAGTERFRFNPDGSFTSVYVNTSQISEGSGSAILKFNSQPNYFNFTTELPINLAFQRNIIGINQTFANSSGGQDLNLINLKPTINQTGTSTSTMRALYINPTLTSAVDFRAIEVTAGKVIIPNGLLSNEAVNKSQLDLKQDTLTLTTTGASGNATLVGSTLNIPNYASGGGGGYTFTNTTNLTATGTNQATALSLPSKVNTITTVAAGTGVILPNAVVSDYITIVNHGASALLIYPASGETVEGGAVNIPFTLFQGQCYRTGCNTAGAWDGIDLNIYDDEHQSLVLNSITTEPPAPTTNSGLLYGKYIAGKFTAKIKGASGLDTPLQNAFWQNNICMWNPTTATAGVWLGTAGAGAGTYTTALPTTTSKYTTIKRGRWANIVTTVNQVLGQRNTEAMFFRGAVAGQGGFFFYARLGFDVWTNGGRFFGGMHSATTVVSANPSALNNTVGFCIDDADNGAISFLTRGTAATKASTGFTAVTGKGYDIFIFCASNSTQYSWRIIDINAETEASGVATATLPTNTTMLTAGVLTSNAALTPVTSIQLGINRIYVETDY